MPDGTHAFEPVIVQPSPARSAVTEGASGLPPSSRDRGGHDGVAADHTPKPPVALRGIAELSDTGCGRGERLDGGDVRGGPPGGLHHEARLDETEAGSAERFGEGDAEQPGRSQLGPELPVEAVAVDFGLELAEALVGGEVGEDPVGQLADGLLFFGE